jgi:hypothetical protein
VDAVYGGERADLLGLEAEVGLGPRWFLALAADRGSLDGALVAVLPGGEVVATGTPTELTLLPVHLTVGRRFGDPRAWSVSLGAGPSLLEWEEDNAVAPASASDPGAHAVLGVRRDLGRWDVGGELRWSTFPDALGEGGVSALFGEDDLGGLAFGLTAGRSFGR